MCFAASNAKCKEKEEVLSTSNKESKVIARKFYSLYEDLQAHPNFFFRISSATFDKLFVLFGPSLTFQDTRLLKSVPPEEKLTVNLT